MSKVYCWKCHKTHQPEMSRTVLQRAGHYQGPLAPNQKMVGLRRFTLPPRAVWRAMWMSWVFMTSSKTTASNSNQAAAQPAQHAFTISNGHHRMGLQKHHTVTWPRIWNLHACNLLTPPAFGVLGHKVTWNILWDSNNAYILYVYVHEKFNQCLTEAKEKHND